jgi:hypothetical protein
MPRKKTNDHGTGVSQQHIDALARCLLPQIEKFYESEAGQREFEEWKKMKTAEKKAKNRKHHGTKQARS